MCKTRVSVGHSNPSAAPYLKGRGELSERQQKLGQFMSRLNKVADEFNVAVRGTTKTEEPDRGCTAVRTSLFFTKNISFFLSFTKRYTT